MYSIPCCQSSVIYLTKGRLFPFSPMYSTVLHTMTSSSLLLPTLAYGAGSTFRAAAERLHNVISNFSIFIAYGVTTRPHKPNNYSYNNNTICFGTISQEITHPGSVYLKCYSHPFNGAKVRVAIVQCSNSQQTIRSPHSQCNGGTSLVKRRDVFGMAIGVSSLFFSSSEAEGAGLPLEEKPKLCDDTCEKELENVPMVTTESGLQYKDIKVGQGPSPPVGFQVAANYVAMVPSGQIFDSSLEKKQLYIFRVGSGQVIKGLDEGMLSMKIGGKRRLYIPGPLAFPKGLTSAPGRPRVAPNSPVVFDVSLEYIPGLEDDEE